MDRRPPPPSFTVDILSDEEEDERSGPRFYSPSPPPRPKKRLELDCHGGIVDGGSGEAPPHPPPDFLVIDDDPTPQKPNPSCTPSFVEGTPLSQCRGFESDASIVKCSLARQSRSSEKISGITGLICLESDNESQSNEHDMTFVSSRCKAAEGSGSYSFQKMEGLVAAVSETLCCPTDDTKFSNHDKNKAAIQHSRNDTRNDYSATMGFSVMVEDNPQASNLIEDTDLQDKRYGGSHCYDMGNQFCGPKKRKEKQVAVDVARNNLNMEATMRKKQLKEEKLRLIEERKQKKQHEKLQKEALKAEAAAAKKIEKEKQKWEKGKFALKSIVAYIDAKVVENGSIGGHLLSRFAEKGLSFRITSNPMEKSILWKIDVPEQISELSSVASEVPYVLLVYQAEEFCDLVISESFTENVHKVRSLYPELTVCYLINKLMSYINKCEQNQYKNPSNVTCWRRSPVEEVLSKLTTHYTKVHSRLCIDEAELAEHIVGLTCSLASCQFRKKLTWLSVHANGSIIPKDFIDKSLIKKSVWLKALIAIPKVQPRHAIAIYKRYPTMRSLLNVYMDPNKSVHDKEFLLKDLMIEGSLGKEDRRFGEICSKRLYRILMAQSGGIKTDDIEEGADFFGF